MSFGKKFESNKSPMSDREVNIKYKMFERLSQKGFLQSMQQQMRRAIVDELNDSTDKQSNEREAEIEMSSRKDNTLNNPGDREEDNWDSLAKVSSIANWEKQIRYELEIDREIQTRELERQKERLKIEMRKLNERDKCLRIELDARERKIRLREEELQISIEELNQKSAEIATKEEMINCIVNQKIKSEMKDEIEKLKKKFNELEINKSNLIKREEKVKEVEQRLHEQVKVVKEKIDNKRLSEIELAKSRKDLEICKKENEVLKERVDSMEDYQLTKFENKSLKNELNAIKETLKNKLIEFESEREKLDKVIKQSDEKVLNLKIDLRKCGQELLLLKQKHQGEIDEYDSKLEQLNSQLKQSKLIAQQLQHKNHLLSKEIISTRNEIQNSMKCNNNLTQTDGQKFGCYICDHNIKAMEESSVEFLLSQKCISDSNKQLISEQKLDLQSLKSSSIPLNTNQENSGLKSSDKMQNEVPLSKTSPTTHAIQHIPNTCAKHIQNGIQLTQTIGDKLTIDREMKDKKTEENGLNLNNVNKNKFEKNSIQDNDISDTFDW